MENYQFPTREFVLINNDNGTSITMGGSDTSNPAIPTNYKEIETVLKRSMDNYGVMTQVSSEYEFITESANFLRSAYAIRDIEANVDLIEYRYHPDTDVKYIYNTSNADFSEYTSNKTTVSLQFKSSGLNSIIKSKRKEKFDLNRTTDINGRDISELITQGVALTTRNIELISKLETLPSDTLTQSFRDSSLAFNYFEVQVGVPLSITYESDDMITTQIRDQSVKSTVNPIDTGLGSMVFYLNNDIEKVLNIDIDLTFTGIYKNIKNLDFSPFFRVIIETYNNGLNLDVVSSKRDVLFEILGETNIVNYFFNETTTTITVSKQITLEEGESLALSWFGGGESAAQASFDVDFDNVTCTVDILEDSTRPNSQSQVVLMKDAGNQIMEVLTGDSDRYVSDFFTNGDFKLCGLTSGLWIRRFYNKKLEISFDQFIENSNSLFLTGYTIDTIDGVEKIVHEEISYFFQNFVSVEITEQVSDITRTALSEQAYASIKMGYKKPSGDNLYEEAQGLDEPNILNSYNTPITRVDESYDKTSDFRADSYGKEFARRKSIETNPSDDTRYDKTIFVLDLKEGDGDLLQERTWQDDFDQEPTGVYSPETITGLRLSPINNLLRHGKFLRSFLNKFVSEYITFNSSVGNELLTTKPIGGIERSEDSPVQINDFDSPLFVNELIEFKSLVTFELNQQIYGRTQIGGRSVPNYFGKVRFINEFGVKEDGFLLELSPNNEGNWTLIKSA